MLNQLNIAFAMDNAKITQHDEIVFFMLIIYFIIAAIFAESIGSLLPFFTTPFKTSNSSFLPIAKEYKSVMTDIVIPEMFI